MRFRLKNSDTIKASLYNSSGKLLTTIYDSGFKNLKSVKEALLRKCCHPPRNTKFSVYKEETNEYWSNF